MEQETFVIRFAHQCGVGLDPLIDHPNRKDGRPKYYRYYRGCDIWHGGTKTAVRYASIEVAKEVIAKHGHTKAHGSKWLGHCWPCEVVPTEQAMTEDPDYLEQFKVT